MAKKHKKNQHPDHEVSEQENAKSSPKTLTDEPKAHSKKETSSGKQAKTSQKLLGIFLVFVGILVLGFLGYFVWNKLFETRPIASLAPAKDTVFLAEVVVDPNDAQLQNFLSLVQKHEVYQKENFLTMVNSSFSIDAEKDLSPWIGRKVGVVFLDNPNQKGTLNPVLFAETRSQDESLKFFKRLAYKGNPASKDNQKALSPTEIEQDTQLLASEDYKGYKIYSPRFQSQEFYFAFADKYVIMAGNASLLYRVLDSKIEGTTLDKDLTYQKVAYNLPRNGIFFAYGNAPKFYETFLINPSLAEVQGSLFTAFEPFLRIFNGEGLSASVRDGKVYAQTFSALDRKKMNGATYITFSEKYRGNLLAYAEENPVLLLGGHNLYKELNRVEEIFKGGAQVSKALFDSFIEGIKEKYLGTDIDLTNDVYPLLKREYLFTISNNFKEPHVSFIIELQDKHTDAMRVDKLVQSLITTGGFFEPKIQDVTLPDGTKGQELVASSEQIEKTETEYKGAPVTALKTGAKGISFYYSVLDGLWLVSSQEEKLQAMIDRVHSKLNASFKTSPPFRSYLQPLLGTADEVFYFKTGAFTQLMNQEENNALKAYLEPFVGVHSSKNFFDDGISSIYVLEVL